MIDDPDPRVELAIAVHNRTGESPLWHPREQVLYWCDIPARRLYRHDPARSTLRHWDFDADVACCAPMLDGGLLLAQRTGLWRFDPVSASLTPLCPPPYDPATERFNDGKCDPRGRFWVSTIYEPREPARAALYRFDGRELARMAGGLTVGNGLAWSPDARTIYWSDTRAHTIHAADFDAAAGSLSTGRVFVRFPDQDQTGAMAHYGGRPDGAAVDVEGCYWVAMYEGQRLLRLSPDARVLDEVRLPARCPTMPCFGGADLRTLYVTTAREGRSAQELALQPLAGSVFQLRVDVPGLPANLYVARGRTAPSKAPRAP